MKKAFSMVVALIGFMVLVVGNASAQVPVIDACIHPETLNLNSRGKWVTSEIYLPGGSEVNLETVRITRIQIPSQNIDVKVNIPHAPDSPWHICRDDGMVELKVKFPRYDKADPSSLQSLVGQLASLLSNAKKGKYRTIVTVEGDLLNNGGSFIGTEDDFGVIKNKKW
jgi:hypothetical protein